MPLLVELTMSFACFREISPDGVDLQFRWVHSSCLKTCALDSSHVGATALADRLTAVKPRIRLS